MTAKRPRRTAERILDVTLAMFNRFGEPNVSTSQLCGELGISPGNLFYHHPTRDALVAGLFARYQAELDSRLAELAPPAPPDAPRRAAPPGEPPPWWVNASSALARLAQLCEALAHAAWIYRFLFRDLGNLVSRQRVLEAGLPPLLRRQADALEQALRGLAWSSPHIDEQDLRLWAGHMLASLTGSVGLDGALDPREHLRGGEHHAIDLAVGRALGLLRPHLSASDSLLLGAHLRQPGQLGMDPWWLGAGGG